VFLFRKSRILVLVVTIVAAGSGLALAHGAGDSCTRLGAVTKIRGASYTCQLNMRGAKVWRKTPVVSSTSSTTTSVATSTSDVTPSLTVSATFINSAESPQLVTVRSTVVGTVYFVEGNVVVRRIADITSLPGSRWTSALIAVPNVDTLITLDAINLTNGYYRAYLLTAQGALSDAASNQVTVSITRTVETVAALGCADGGPCAIGDIGPGGGVVFILATTAGNTTGRTFEAARKDWDGGAQDGTEMWCGASDASISGLGTAIGTGSTNSSTIATTCTSTGTNDAAEYVRGKTIGGKSDWFLPSRDEALEIYAQRSVFTGNYEVNTTTVDTARYLTSTQSSSFTSNATGAYLQGSVAPGTAQDVSKSFGFSVRPVRSFISG